MKIVVLFLKLLGSALIGFAGYFVANAVGWPGDLDAMTMERGFIGGALALLGGLCGVSAIITAVKPPPRAKAPASTFAETADDEAAPRPFWTEDIEAAAEPEPIAAVAPFPDAEPDPPAIAETAEIAQSEPEEPQAEITETNAPPEAELEAAPEPAPAEPLPSPPGSLIAAQGLLDQGDRHFSEGRIEDALDPYAEALEMARGLDRTAPSDETRDLLACALKAVGDVHDEMVRLDPATEHYEEALGIRRSQLQADPDNSARQRALSLVLERLGDVREARGHTTRALDLYRTSLPIAEQLAAADPENPVYREDLAATKNRIVELESHMV